MKVGNKGVSNFILCSLVRNEYPLDLGHPFNIVLIQFHTQTPNLQHHNFFFHQNNIATIVRNKNQMECCCLNTMVKQLSSISQLVVLNFVIRFPQYIKL